MSSVRRCANCSKRIPSAKLARAIYCSRECKIKASNKRLRAREVAARGMPSRISCENPKCNALIRGRRWGVKYCSPRCAKQFHEACYKARNPEIFKAKGKRYRADNPEKVATNNARWAKNNPDKVAAIQKTHRDKKSKLNIRMRALFDGVKSNPLLAELLTPYLENMT